MLIHFTVVKTRSTRRDHPSVMTLMTTYYKMLWFHANFLLEHKMLWH